MDLSCATRPIELPYRLCYIVAFASLALCPPSYEVNEGFVAALSFLWALPLLSPAKDVDRIIGR